MVILKYLKGEMKIIIIMMMMKEKGEMNNKYTKINR